MFDTTISKWTRGLAAAGIAVLLASCSTGGGTTGEPGQGGAENGGPITFEWGMATGAYLATYVALERGYFEDEGLAPNIHVFQSGAPMLAALESKSLDLGTVGLATVFALGNDIDITYYALEGDASAAEGLVSRAGGAVKNLADIANGAPIAVATGTCAQVSAYYAAESIGVDYAELNTVDVVANLLGNSFASGSIDAGFSWSPFLVQLQEEGNELIGWDEDWVPNGGTCPEAHFGRSAFLTEHPEVPIKMIQALDRAWDDLRSDRSIVVPLLMEKLSISESTATQVVDRYVDAQPTLEDMLEEGNRFSFVDDGGMVEQLKLASEAFADLGVISEPLTLERLRQAVDPTALEAVVAAR